MSSPTAAAPIVIGLLKLSENANLCDWFDRVIRGGAASVFGTDISSTITLKIFHVHDGELPSSIRECDHYFVTGSRESVYDESVSWIPGLFQFMSDVVSAASEPGLPDVRLACICFGHQCLGAVAAGRRSAVRKAAVGWGVGPRTIAFDRTFEAPWFEPRLETLTLLTTHQDQVDPEALRGVAHARVLASTEFCPVEMLLVSHPETGAPRAVSLQPHIELPPCFLVPLFESRRARMGCELTDSAIAATLAAAQASGMDTPRSEDLLAAKLLVQFLLH
eukprot:Amastigsp_a179965_18.p1 type:complete len:277 gc:universal Amastigsp_a179965_18:95-925(+)